MKKFSGVTAVVVMTLLLTVGLSWGYESEKSAGGLSIKLVAGSYPLVKGDNAISVKITDNAGKAVTNAKVAIRFYMPAMPGMAPMSSNIDALLKGDVYMVTVNPAMEGTWKADVSVTRPGAAAAKTTFNLDAR